MCLLDGTASRSLCPGRVGDEGVPVPYLTLTLTLGVTFKEAEANILANAVSWHR